MCRVDAKLAQQQRALQERQPLHVELHAVGGHDGSGAVRILTGRVHDDVAQA